MKWIIKNPAPSDSRREKWGDFHFGRSLSKYLTRLGIQVETQYDPGWSEDTPCDVVLLLRGKYPFPPTPTTHGGALRVMWNISHPADVSLEEYESYDLVFVASATWAHRLRPQISPPVFPLLQCTDPEEFFERPMPHGQARTDFVFVGNTRDVERPAALWALDYGVPLKIWGRGWEQQVVADYLPNQELGDLYSRSRATLNDHWPDMKEFGFVNNRIFDALICGLPVISDWHEELESLFPDGILFYRDREEFERCVEAVLLDYPRVQERARDAAVVIRQEFSFERRAELLSDLVNMTMKVGGTQSRELEDLEALTRRTAQAEAEAKERYCPICQTFLKGFRPFGVQRRENAQCPKCGALERHRLIWAFLIARTDLFDGRPKSLLHIAPERYIAPLLWQIPKMTYLSADLESSVAMERLDLTDAHYPDGSFDVILCNHVLEHIPEDGKAMRELFRILKPGGWAVMQVPISDQATDEDPSVTDPKERQRRFGQIDHVRLYGPDYKDRLAAAGFDVTVDGFAREIDPAVARLCGIKDQNVYFCKRSDGPIPGQEWQAQSAEGAMQPEELDFHLGELARYRAELDRLRGASGELRLQLNEVEKALRDAKAAAREHKAEALKWKTAHERLSGPRGRRDRKTTSSLDSEQAVAAPPHQVTDLRRRLLSMAASGSGPEGQLVVGVLGAAEVVDAVRAAGWAAMQVEDANAPVDVLVVADRRHLDADLPREAVTVGWIADPAWLSSPWLDQLDVLLTMSSLRDAVGAATAIPQQSAPSPAGLGESLMPLLQRWASAVQFAICIGTPSWAVSDSWGDTFFARAVQRQLLSRGHPTRVYVRNEHQVGHLGRADVVLHLLGLAPPEPRPGQVNVVWIISHPELATVERCAKYDLVGVASGAFAASLTPHLDVPVVTLLQATDEERFLPDASGPAHELLFVGNSRRTRRTIIDDVTPTVHDLAVYGLDWTPDLVDPRHLRGELVPNRELNRYYASASVVLNDHWPAMAQWGFVSNRLYDASAAGAFVVSDHVDGIDDLFDGGVVTYRGRADLAAKVERFLGDPVLRAAHAERARSAVLARHTFGHRIDRLLELVHPVLADAGS